LHLVGDKWVLLVIRELLFGNHRFEALARNTGAPRDRLAARLRSLEDAGVVTRVPYSDHPRRYEYHLTDAGRDLAPVVQALRRWGDTWAIERPPVTVSHRCGHELDEVRHCRACGEEIREGDVTVRVETDGWDLHGLVE
jgi:DNA-binding HxlR family transcriptional regulator